MTNNLDASNMNKVRLRNMETNFEHLHKGWTSLSHVLQRTVLSSLYALQPGLPTIRKYLQKIMNIL